MLCRNKREQPQKKPNVHRHSAAAEANHVESTDGVNYIWVSTEDCWNEDHRGQVSQRADIWSLRNAQSQLSLHSRCAADATHTDAGSRPTTRDVHCFLYATSSFGFPQDWPSRQRRIWSGVLKQKLAWRNGSRGGGSSFLHPSGHDLSLFATKVNQSERCFTYIV